MKGVPDKAGLLEIVERLRGGATLISQSKSCGFSGNNELRGALRKLLGTEGYNELMQTKRPAALQRPTGVNGEPVPMIDDTGVPVIYSTPTAAGWRVRYINDEAAFVAPDGTWYTRAPANAKADLIVDLTEHELSRTRLRKVPTPPHHKAAPVPARTEDNGEALDIAEAPSPKKEKRTARKPVTKRKRK